MSDDRRAARRAILAGVRATFEGATGQRQQADVANLGPRGLFLLTDSPVSVGKRLSLEIHVLGQANPWQALGRVVWTRWLLDDSGPPGMGVTLIDMEDDVAQAVAKLVERLAPPEPPAVPDAPPSRPRVPGAGSLAPVGAVLVAPIVHAGRAVKIEPHLPSREQLAAPNLAIDLVTRKANGPHSSRGPRPPPNETWDDDESTLPKTHWARWIVVGLLVVTVAGAGYAYRARLRAEWHRLRAHTKSAQTDALDGSTRRAARA